jgi:ABC-type transport system substrate-binding protein
VETDDGWTVTVDVRADALWSDGEPITADDVAFTYETVRDVGLTRGWTTAYPLAGGDGPGLSAVEAIDDDTVRFTFDSEPGLAIWPNGPGIAPVMPAHHWRPIVTDAVASEAPDLALLSTPGVGEPSGGPAVLEEVAGTTVRLTPNPNFVRTGERVTSGGVSYEFGPFFDEMIFTIFSSRDAAAGAVAAGDVDIVLSPSGFDEASTALALEDGDVTAITNTPNGFRYLGFNLRRVPMSSLGFRNALAAMIDKELMANRTLDLAADQAVRGRPRSLDELAKEVDALDFDQLNRFVATHRPGEMTTVTIGPAALKLPGT